MHGVYVATAPESASAALDAIRHELRAVVEAGLPADEVAMGRQQLKGQVTLSLESVSSRMYRAASVELYGEPRAVATGLSYARYDEVVRAVGGFGAWVTESLALGPALDEAFACGVPACVNVKLGASDFRKGAISV